MLQKQVSVNILHLSTSLKDFYFVETYILIRLHFRSLLRLFGISCIFVLLLLLIDKVFEAVGLASHELQSALVALRGALTVLVLEELDHCCNLHPQKEVIY